MAKNKSIIKIEGSIGDLTFYKKGNGYFVRSKGGVSKSKIMSDPAFIRTRENMNEFGHIAKSGKMFRRRFTLLLNKAKDKNVRNRMSSLLSKIKNSDSSSERGKRRVGIGLQSNEGKQLFAGFDFNEKAPLGLILHHDFSLDEATGKIEMADFIPNEYLNVPEGATHVKFSSAMLNFDFDSYAGDLKISPPDMMAIDHQTHQVSLTPSSVPVGTGQVFYFMLIEFFQEVNGQFYALHNGAFNVLNLIKVV